MMADLNAAAIAYFPKLVSSYSNEIGDLHLFPVQAQTCELSIQFGQANKTYRMELQDIVTNGPREIQNVQFDIERRVQEIEERIDPDGLHLAHPFSIHNGIVRSSH